MQRGKVFSKLSRLISVAAKEGPNPDMNPKLKQAIDEAREANMPKDNIEKAIKKGTGELLDGQVLEEISYEAFGPGGIALIVEGITDNKNRALAEVKQILNKYNGKMANEGSVRWLFEKRGILALPSKYASKKEELELKAIEAGALDLNWYEEEGESYLEILCEPEKLEGMKKGLREQNLEWETANLGWIAKEEIIVPENELNACRKMFEELDENEAVQNIYSNLKN